MPFTEALTQKPSYAKFLKEIISNKRKLEDHETVAMTLDSSVVIAVLCFGLPRVIVSDNDMQFANSSVVEFCKDLGIQNQFS